MNSACLFPALLLSLVALRGAAQPADPATPPATERRAARPAPIRSPEITAEGKVTFRLRAPKATEVVVAGQWPDGRLPMTRDSNAVWSVTTEPIKPGVWEYSFQVDGLTMIDPGNPAIKPMREPRTSILHLPGQPHLIHDFQDVPHGTVRAHTYRSKSLDRLRNLAVYTPPNYDQQPDRRLPVLYLQHGAGDNQDTWTVHGKAHWILDNLIAAGRAQPMILVMVDGHAATGARGGAFQNNTAFFERDLLEDVIPFIEANYRVRADSAHRGIVGLSMGGGQSLTIGLKHAARFAWVGGFSSAVPALESVASALDDSAATNQRLKLLWIACGRDDFLLRRNEDFIVLLKEKGVQHEWRLTDGNHSWPVWRGYLAEFLPRLFQP